MSSVFDGVLAGGGSSSGGSGDVVGPASSTDNAVARFDSTTGKLLQNSTLYVTDDASPKVQFGGNTANEGMLLANTIYFEFKKADDSGWAHVHAGDIYAEGAFITNSATGQYKFQGLDTGLARNAAGVVKVTDGSTGYGGIVVKDGTKSAAGLSFATGGTDTGLFQRADNTLMFAAEGHEVANLGYSATAPSLVSRFGIGLLSNDADAASTTVALVYRADGLAQIAGSGGATSTIGALLSSKWVYASTAGSGSPLALGADNSGTAFTNEGATAASYFTLPTAAAGYQFTFIVQDADGMRVVANAGDTIRVIDKVTAAAGYIESTTIGSVVTLVAINATEWVATSIHGVWTDGTFTYDDTSLTTP